MPAKEKASSDESELQTYASGCVAQIYTASVVQVFQAKNEFPNWSSTGETPVAPVLWT